MGFFDVLFLNSKIKSILSMIDTFETKVLKTCNGSHEFSNWFVCSEIRRSTFRTVKDIAVHFAKKNSSYIIRSIEMGYSKNKIACILIAGAAKELAIESVDLPPNMDENNVVFIHEQFGIIYDLAIDELESSCEISTEEAKEWKDHLLDPFYEVDQGNLKFW